MIFNFYTRALTWKHHENNYKSQQKLVTSDYMPYFAINKKYNLQ